LYVDGTERGSAPFSAATGGAGPLLIGAGLRGALDQVGIRGRALAADEVQTLSAAESTHIPVSLDQPGATSTSWRLDVPAGLEGFYQLDITAADSLGNRGISSSVWRGTVDTLAPRLTITASATGRSYTDPADGRIYRDVAYTIRAEDRHLSADGLLTPCDG